LVTLGEGRTKQNNPWLPSVKREKQLPLPPSTLVTLGEERAKQRSLLSSTFVTLGYQSILLYPLLLW
ncbi:Transmembrane domain-containing protein, partial [Brazilian cedratvirus IHUMI]